MNVSFFYLKRSTEFFLSFSSTEGLLTINIRSLCSQSDCSLVTVLVGYANYSEGLKRVRERRSNDTTQRPAPSEARMIITRSGVQVVQQLTTRLPHNRSKENRLQY